MNLLFASAAALAIVAAASSLSATAAAQDTRSAASGWIAQQAPGYYRFRLGDFRITVLSDGTAPRDLPRIMSQPDAVRAAFAASHQALPVELSINAYLIDTGDKRILVDTGAGELFGATSGYLVANLRAAGYVPDDIDAVLLTHIHGDHSGGLSIGGKQVFPNAIVYVDRRDPAHWLSAEEEAKAPANRRGTFSQSHQTVDPYVRASKLRTFDGATELFPGIRSVPEYGHTPGLTSYMVESGGQRLLLWGDIVHAAEVQFADPSVTIEYDVDPAQAVDTRERVLRDAAERGYLVGGAHLSFPGIGHVRSDNGRYAWVPAPYQAKP
jgi:glyoxylase-like metal-dependent hydrolase (beta-lactamase superfamily II)